MIKIAIIIPTYNRRKSVENLLSCIKSQELDSSIELTTFLVIDGSTDGTIELVKNDFSEVICVMGSGTWWFTKSINEGIKIALTTNPDFVLTLNDDIVLRTNYIKSLVETYKQIDKDSILGSISLTISEPYRLFISGVRSTNFYTYSARQYRPFMDEVTPTELSGVFPSTWVPSRGMLIPMTILKKLDFLDEKFPQYGSDTDLWYRAMKIDVKTYVSYNSIVYNDWKRTGSGSPFIQQSLRSFFLNFMFNRYSSRYLGNNIRIIWRHTIKLLFPFLVIKVTIAKFLSYYKNQKHDV